AQAQARFGHARPRRSHPAPCPRPEPAPGREVRDPQPRPSDGPKVRNREQLLETLEAYLARGSVKEAAAALGLHRHTVLYRLEKLRELLGEDLEVPATRLRLQLALDLQKLL